MPGNLPYEIKQESKSDYIWDCKPQKINLKSKPKLFLVFITY